MGHYHEVYFNDHTNDGPRVGMTRRTKAEIVRERHASGFQWPGAAICRCDRPDSQCPWTWDLPSDREAAAREENVMANENAPRAYTAEEVRTQLLEHIWVLIRYWAGLDGSNVPEGYNHMDRLEGLAHSLLVVQEAEFEPDYERSGSPLYWKRQGTSATLKEAVAIVQAEWDLPSEP